MNAEHNSEILRSALHRMVQGSAQDDKKRVTYELVIFEWRAAVPPEWKLEFRQGLGASRSIGTPLQDWQPAKIAVELHAGDQLRGNGGPEEEYLAAMLEHGYLKEVVSDQHSAVSKP